MSSQHRSLRNMFVRPKFQLRFSLSFMVIGLIILSMVGFLVLESLDEVQSLMNSGEAANYARQAEINDKLLACVQMALAGFGLFIAVSLVFSLVVGHRIAGPQVAITAYIEELKKGNYESKRGLRPFDELVEIMNALRELGSILMEREKELGKSQGKARHELGKS